MANPNTISWMTYQDIGIKDIDTKKQFDDLMRGGKYAEAISLLSSAQELKGKAFIANAINSIINGIMELQTLFNDGVHLFLTDSAMKFMDAINTLLEKDEWQNNVQYTPYNFVVYQDNLYMCIKKPNIGTLPTSQEFWLELGLQGTKGTPGTNVVMRYNWNATANYVLGDLVVYQSNIYVCIKPNKGVLPTEVDSWLLFIEVNKGKLLVTDTEPLEVVDNSIWIRTKQELGQTNALSGELQRKISSSTQSWERMNPFTTFELVTNKQEYEPYCFTEDIVIKAEDWKKESIGVVQRYYYIYKNPRIKNPNSVVQIIQNDMNKEQYSIYCQLAMDTVDDEARIFLSYSRGKPEINLPLTIRIQ